MKPYLSIVIPSHNAPRETMRLVTSLLASKKAPPFEVIVVDDGSAPQSRFSIIDFPFGKAQGRRLSNKTKKKKMNVPVRVVTLVHNSGPAKARNKGASIAKGKFIVFMDCDVVPFPDTLANIARTFNDDPDVVALTGVWVKEQETSDFFPNFKALRDWSYWINERDKSGYYFLFSTRIAAIKKSVFLRLGGFNESYMAALVEDIELTYRIARRYAIIFAPDVRVRHEFEGFFPIAKKYFLRAYHWTKLYAKRKKFDPVATTMMEAITSVTGVGTVTFFILAMVIAAITQWAGMAVGGHVVNGSLASLGALTSLMYMNVGVLTVWLSVTVLHTFLIRKFLYFLYQEKGIVFAIRGYFTGLVLYCFIAAGAAWGKIH